MIEPFATADEALLAGDNLGQDNLGLGMSIDLWDRKKVLASFSSRLRGSPGGE
jgi:hypothetical protein